ncbi:MAG: ABC transporter ATP-binding protein [Eubacteriales bacterium]
MSLLLIQDLNFSYEDRSEILRGINLTFDTKPTAIIGQNGAGKTTFVKLLKGLLRPTSGSIFYQETDISSLSVATLAKDIGLIFQNPNDQIFGNNVKSEVMFGPLQIGMSKQEAEKRSIDALTLVGLSKNLTTNPYDLGLSARKLVSIASIIAMNPQVVIFDEPTIAQDFHGKELIAKIMRELTGQGKLVISILHDMEFVAENFERVIVFSQGSVLLDDTARAVFAQKEVLEKAHLEQPCVTKLGGCIGYDQVFLTAQEFIEFHQNPRKPS